MKSRKIIKILILLSVVIMPSIFLRNLAFPFDVVSHKAINSFLTDEKSTVVGSQLNDYLKNHVAMQDGVKTILKSNMVKEWIAYGGEREDDGMRPLNHFYNPLTNNGLPGQYSALTWAVNQSYYSWNNLRNYYYQALTAADRANRDYWFVQTFQGLGQMMHLVQDMSIPAHVRRDIHPSDSVLGINIGKVEPYEMWTQKNVNDKTLSNTAYPAYNYTPYNSSSFIIPQLFDTDQYVGSNPDVTTASGGIGLSEYSNANFFSNSTINDGDFSSPRTDSNKKTAKPFTGPNGTFTREYFIRDCNENYCQSNASKNYSGYLLSAVDMYDYWRLKHPNARKTRPIIPILDDNVHYDYARLLVPRAIGYSAQVLGCFFRGQLDVEMGKGSLKVKNTSSETIVGGNANNRFELYYDNSNGVRTLLTSVPADALAPGTEQTITFTAPENVESYMLVYQGQLGSEINAVIGKYVPVNKQKYYILDNFEVDEGLLQWPPDYYDSISMPNFAVVNYSNCKITKSEKMFGTSSAVLENDGVYSGGIRYYLTNSSHSGYYKDGVVFKDFTIQAFIRIGNNFTGYVRPFDLFFSTPNKGYLAAIQIGYWYDLATESYYITAFIYDKDKIYYAGTQSHGNIKYPYHLMPDVWHHIAVVVKNRDILLFIDGNLFKQYIALTENPFATSLSILSFYKNGGSPGEKVYIDSYAFSPGALWTENFIPPAHQLSASP